VYGGWRYLSIFPAFFIYINKKKLGTRRVGFKHSYSTIVQMKERNSNNNRKHSKESKLKMSFSSGLSSPVKLLDLETSKEKLFNSNVQAANFLNISE